MADFLKPFSNELSKLIGIATCLQALAGIIVVQKIVQNPKTVYNADFMIWSIIATSLSCKFGLINKQFANVKIFVNIFGIVSNLLFLTIILIWGNHSNRRTLLFKIVLSISFVFFWLMFVGSEQTETEDYSERLTFMLSCTLVGMLIVQGMNLVRALQDHCRDNYDDIEVTAANTLVALSWTLYGLSRANSMLWWQNIVPVFTGIVKIVLYYTSDTRLNTFLKFKNVINDGRISSQHEITVRKYKNQNLIVPERKKERRGKRNLS